MIDHPTSYALLAARGLPVVTTIQSFNVIKTSSGFQNWRYKRIISYNVKRLKYVVSVSNFVSTELEDVFGSRATAFIPNAINTEEFKPGTSIERGEMTLRLLFTGNLIPRKSVDILIRAFELALKKAPKLQLDIIGDGPEKERLVALSSELGLESKTRFMGQWPWERVKSAYPDYDIFIMPSTNEGLSLSMLEAMSCGLCVIAGKPSVGTYDALIDKTTGLYYEYGKASDLADKILMLSADQHLRRSLSGSARAFAVEHFDISQNARELVKLFQRISSNWEKDETPSE